MSLIHIKESDHTSHLFENRTHCSYCFFIFFIYWL